MVALQDIAVSALVAVLVFGAGYGIGHSVAVDKAHKAEVKKLAEAAAEIDSLNKQVFAQKEKFDGKVSDLRASFAKDEAVASADHARVVAALRDGSKRLRLNVASCDQTHPTPVAGAASGTDAAGTAELPAATGVALYQLVDEADANARKLTALQEWSRSAVEFCKGNSQ